MKAKTVMKYIALLILLMSYVSCAPIPERKIYQEAPQGSFRGVNEDDEEKKSDPEENEEDSLLDGEAANSLRLATYNRDVKAIIDANCAKSGCHIPGQTEPDLSTYAKLKESNQDGVEWTERSMTRILEETMGYGAYGDLTEDDVILLIDWSDNNYAE